MRGLVADGEITFFRGNGCKDCGQTGYLGLAGIFELAILNEEIRQLILDRATRHDISEAIRNKGTATLYQDALKKVVKGVTTYEEILNIADLEIIRKP
jgi:type II secretory ATPase GspE/PulE/Tfp pilus assembly ATPase PilB-like protein